MHSIPLQPASLSAETLQALRQQMPLHMIPRDVVANATAPNWDIFVRTQGGVMYRIARQEIQAFLGEPFTVHLVSDADSISKKGPGGFGVISVGTFDNEANDLAVIGEKNGGGTASVQYAIHPQHGLLIGLQREVRNRKDRLVGYGVPRGYDDLLFPGLRDRVATAMRELMEEATSFKGMQPETITWADGTPFLTDQNSGVFKCGAGEGFGYQSIQWPDTLLVEVRPGVFVPDTANTLVNPSGGDAEHGHTGELFFVTEDNLYDKSIFPDWSPEVSADGLGYQGIPALKAMLKRKGILK